MIRGKKHRQRKAIVVLTIKSRSRLQQQRCRPQNDVLKCIFHRDTGIPFIEPITCLAEYWRYLIVLCVQLSEGETFRGTWANLQGLIDELSYHMPGPNAYQTLSTLNLAPYVAHLRVI